MQILKLLKTNIEVLTELVLINLFILNLAVGSISNFSLNIFLLKTVCSLLLLATTVIVFRKQSSGNRNPVSDFQKQVPAYAEGNRCFFETAQQDHIPVLFQTPSATGEQS